MRLLDYDAEKQIVIIVFSYDEELVQYARALPERKWNPQEKFWFTPSRFFEEVISTFEEHQFSFSQLFREFIEKERELKTHTNNSKNKYINSISKTVAERRVQQKALSVFELNTEAKKLIGGRFRTALLLDAEVSGYARNKKTGHAYFELVDRREGSTAIVASISAVCFETARSRILGNLARVGTELRDGEKYRFIVQPDMYEKTGTFQVRIQNIEMETLFDKAKKRLEEVLGILRKERILRNNVDIPIPICPLRIGLVSAVDSDAYNDFVHELELSGLRFSIIFRNAKMQGVEAGKSIARAIRGFNRDEVDVIAVVRGGGSKVSLADLDTLEIGRAICKSSIKTICGIGHHRDQGLLDMISLSEKTPTAAAILLVERVTNFLDHLDGLEARILYGAEQVERRASQGFERLVNSLERTVFMRTQNGKKRLTALEFEIPNASKLFLNASEINLERTRSAVRTHSKNRTGMADSQLEQDVIRLKAASIETRLQRENETMDNVKKYIKKISFIRLSFSEKNLLHVKKQLEWMRPETTVQRGYAILRKKGVIVKNVTKLKEGDLVMATLRDGEIEMLVRNSKKGVSDGES